jgi:hypothetical protein
MSKCRKLCSNFWVIRGARDDSESSSATRIRFSRRSPDIVAVLVATQRDCGLGTEHRSGSPCNWRWITHVMICEPRRGAVFSERLMRGLVAVSALSPRRIRGCFGILRHALANKGARPPGDWRTKPFDHEHGIPYGSRADRSRLQRCADIPIGGHFSTLRKVWSVLRDLPPA